MKNVMKKVFSMLLVGVVAVSMFGFIAPTRAEATEENTNGTVELYNYTNDKYNFIVSFYKDEDLRNIIDRRKRMEPNSNCDFKIPSDAELILVKVKIYNDNTKSFKYIDTLKFEMSENKACSEDIIKIACVEQDKEKLVSECTNGWKQI